MLITKSALRKIIKEELVKESLFGNLLSRLRRKPSLDRPKDEDLAIYKMQGMGGHAYLVYNPQVLSHILAEMSPEEVEIEVTMAPDMDMVNRLALKVGAFLGYMIVRSTKTTTNKPCIPKTYDVAFSGVWPLYRSKGFGELLYKVVAADLGMKDDAGLTSDRDVSTSMSAAKLWRKLQLSMVPRETEDGNDEFDYDKSTADPNDDCVLPQEPENAINKSLALNPTEENEFELLYKQMIANHKEFTAAVKAKYGIARPTIDRFLRAATQAEMPL